MAPPSARSSDLEIARQISRRLRTEEAPTASGGSSPPDAGYVRFVVPGGGAEATGAIARRPEPRDGGRPAVDDAPHRLWERESLGSRYWDELLQECLALLAHVGGEAALVVDGRGLAIANLGSLGSDEAEDVGARLVIAMEQTHRMEVLGAEAGCIGVEFGARWLTGIRVLVGGGAEVTIGLVTAQPVPGADRDRIRHLMAEGLAGS